MRESVAALIKEADRKLDAIAATASSRRSSQSSCPRQRLAASHALSGRASVLSSLIDATVHPRERPGSERPWASSRLRMVSVSYTHLTLPTNSRV